MYYSTRFYSNLDLKGVLIGLHFEIFSYTVNNRREHVKLKAVLQQLAPLNLSIKCVFITTLQFSITMHYPINGYIIFLLLLQSLGT